MAGIDWLVFGLSLHWTAFDQFSDERKKLFHSSLLLVKKIDQFPYIILRSSFLLTQIFDIVLVVFVNEIFILIYSSIFRVLSPHRCNMTLVHVDYRSLVYL